MAHLKANPANNPTLSAFQVLLPDKNQVRGTVQSVQPVQSAQSLQSKPNPGPSTQPLPPLSTYPNFTQSVDPFGPSTQPKSYDPFGYSAPPTRHSAFDPLSYPATGPSPYPSNSGYNPLYPGSYPSVAGLGQQGQQPGNFSGGFGQGLSNYYSTTNSNPYNSGLYGQNNNNNRYPAYNNNNNNNNYNNNYHSPSDSGSETDTEYSYDSRSTRSRSRRRRHRRQPLTSAEERIILQEIQRYLPPDNRDIIFKDIVENLNDARKRGHGDSSPRHPYTEDDMTLYSERLKKEAEVAKSRVLGMLDFGAFMATSFGSAMGIQWVKTNRIHGYMKNAIDNGEFDDSLEGIGPSLRGTVFESPAFGCALKVIEIVSNAHQDEMKDEADRQDEEVKKADARRGHRQEQVRSLQVRSQKMSSRPSSSAVSTSQTATAGLPRPDTFHQHLDAEKVTSRTKPEEKKNDLVQQPVVSAVKDAVKGDMKDVIKDAVSGSGKISEHVPSPGTPKHMPSASPDESSLSSEQKVEEYNTYSVSRKKKSLGMTSSLAIPKEMEEKIAKMAAPLVKMIDVQGSEGSESVDLWPKRTGRRSNRS